MDLEQLCEKAEKKIFDLRSLASLDWKHKMYEPLRLFKEIQEDPKCRAILSNVKRNIKEAVREEQEQNQKEGLKPKEPEESEIILLYNEHIRKSNLSEEQKAKLFI